MLHLSRLPRLAPALLLMLAGCGLFGGGKPPEPCPSAVILRPLTNTAVFAPEIDNPRPENVAFYGLLSEVDSKCRFTGEGVRMSLDVIVVGERGPAAKGDEVDLDYFVAVVGPGEAIISKKPFRVHIVFPPGQKRAGVSDHIEELIPPAAGRAADLSLDLGFQEAPQAISFYKRFRGR